jgi:hypothetical protein
MTSSLRLNPKTKSLIGRVGRRRGEAQSSVIRRLEAAGILRPAGKKTPLSACNPRPLRGGPISRTLREERDVS